MIRRFVGHKSGVSAIAVIKNPQLKDYPQKSKVDEDFLAERSIIISGCEFPACEILAWSLDFDTPLD